jgi:hypothetical protein
MYFSKSPKAPEEDELIKVGDKMIPMSQITEADKERMTSEEYTVKKNNPF